MSMVGKQLMTSNWRIGRVLLLHQELTRFLLTDEFPPNVSYKRSALAKMCFNSPFRN